MNAARQIECDAHGKQEATFVCQHVVNGMRNRQAVGFFWSPEDASPRPDAWCRECNDRVAVTGGEWIGEAAEHLGLSVLCAKCYDVARQLNLGSEE